MLLLPGYENIVVDGWVDIQVKLRFGANDVRKNLSVTDWGEDDKFFYGGFFIWGEEQDKTNDKTGSNGRLYD